VIVLFGSDTVQWESGLSVGDPVKMGQLLGRMT